MSDTEKGRVPQENYVSEEAVELMAYFRWEWPRPPKTWDQLPDGMKDNECRISREELEFIAPLLASPQHTEKGRERVLTRDDGERLGYIAQNLMCYCGANPDGDRGVDRDARYLLSLSRAAISS